MADLATAYLRLIPSLKGAQRTIENELGGINTKSTGDALGGNLGEGIKGGLGKIAIGNFLGNMLTQGVDMAVSAITDTFKAAFNEAADFEQLAGGVKKLYRNQFESVEQFAEAFDLTGDMETARQWFEDMNKASDLVMENAQKAYRTAGMSANQYMETATQFSASLTSALAGDVDMAAKLTDVAMRSMSDNVNVFGSNMEDVSNAYKGFAKQNYTMLDNLKLGYGGTKEEMARLVEDAAAMTDVQEKLNEKVDAGSLSFDNIIRAIDVIQYKQNIYGTTAEEAAKTVSGSIGMMQAAWTNLLTELGKPDGDIEARITELVESIGYVLENALPLVGRILEGIGKAISDFAAKAGEYFMEHRTEVYDKVGEFIKAVLEAIVTAIPYIVEGIAYLIASLIEYVVTHIPEMLEAAGQLMLAFLQAVANAAGPAMTAMNEVGQSVLDGIGQFFSDMFNAGVNLIQGFIDGILSMPGRVIDAITSAVGGAVDWAKNLLGIASPSKVFKQIGVYTVEGYIEGVDGLAGKAKSAIGDVMRGVVASGSVSVDGGSATQAAGNSVVLNINVESREDDPYELAQMIGDAVAIELRMQGVCA